MLAAALRRGDACAARVQMHGLERQTRLAIAAGRVPAPFRTRLTNAEEELAAQMPQCVPPRPPPPPPPAPHPAPPRHETKHHGPDGKHHDKHGKGHGG